MKEKKIKIKDVLKTVGEGALGFATGGHLVSLFFDFKGKIAKERINKFSEQFLRCLEEVVGKEFDIENLKTEDFMDAFEIIAKRAVLTKSKEKLARYKNVLVKEVFQPNAQSDSFSKYINLIEDLNETQILILKEMENSKTKKTPWQILNLIAKGSNSKVEISVHDNYTTFTGENLNYDDFAFYLQELAGKGLLYRKTETKRNIFGGVETYEMNSIGSRFLKFIKEYEPKDA